MKEQPRRAIDFEKYKSRAEENPKDIEAGFTAADYDDHGQAPGTHAPWMSSSRVILLIEYLRKYPNQGAILYERFGTVGLKFNPGIKGDDIKNGRAQIAMNMFFLLEEAAPDLKEMISKGIDIPLLVRHQPKAKVQ